MAKEPWFKAWSAEILTDEKMDRMPPEAEGLLWRMWCVCNLRGFIPADPEEIARLTCRKMSYVSHCVSHCVPFFELRNGNYYSRRMEAEKEKSAAARRSAQVRYNKGTSGELTAIRTANRTANRIAKNSEFRIQKEITPTPSLENIDLKPSEVSKLVQQELGLSGQTMWILSTECVEKLCKAENLQPPKAAEEIVARWKAYEAKPKHDGEPHRKGKKGWLESGGYLERRAAPRDPCYVRPEDDFLLRNGYIRDANGKPVIKQ